MPKSDKSSESTKKNIENKKAAKKSSKNRSSSNSSSGSEQKPKKDKKPKKVQAWDKFNDEYEKEKALNKNKKGKYTRTPKQRYLKIYSNVTKYKAYLDEYIRREKPSKSYLAGKEKKNSENRQKQYESKMEKYKKGELDEKPKKPGPRKNKDGKEIDSKPKFSTSNISEGLCAITECLTIKIINGTNKHHKSDKKSKKEENALSIEITVNDLKNSISSDPDLKRAFISYINDYDSSSSYDVKFIESKHVNLMISERCFGSGSDDVRLNEKAFQFLGFILSQNLSRLCNCLYEIVTSADKMKISCRMLQSACNLCYHDDLLKDIVTRVDEILGLVTEYKERLDLSKSLGKPDDKDNEEEEESDSEKKKKSSKKDNKKQTKKPSKKDESEEENEDESEEEQSESDSEEEAASD